MQQRRSVKIADLASAAPRKQMSESDHAISREGASHHPEPACTEKLNPKAACTYQSRACWLRDARAHCYGRSRTSILRLATRNARHDGRLAEENTCRGDGRYGTGGPCAFLSLFQVYAVPDTQADALPNRSPCNIALQSPALSKQNF